MKEGEAGQKKINQYTRYFTVVLAFVEAVGLRLPVQEPGRLPRTWARARSTST